MNTEISNQPITGYPITESHPMEGMALLRAVGNTPLLPLRRVTSEISPNVKVYAKAEWFNPGGSVKDRPAFNIIRSALNECHMLPGMRLLDSTSGNMGIAYATFGAALDIPITLVMPENASSERKAILRALGAELVLTDPLEGSDGSIMVARQMADENPDLYFYANQYDNPANWLAHYRTTGPEIIDQTGGAITHFVAGLGTSGDFKGPIHYICVYLHDQGVFYGNTSAVDDSVNFQSVFLEAFHNDPCAKGGGFNQCPIYLFGCGVQRHADKHSGESLIHQDRPVAVMPIQIDQPAFTGI